MRSLAMLGMGEEVRQKMKNKKQGYYKNWANEHKEERRLYRQKWYQENKPRINILQNEYKKARYKREPEYREKIKARTRAWYQKNSVA